MAESLGWLGAGDAVSFGIRTFDANGQVLSSFEEGFPNVWRVYRVDPTGSGAETGYLEVPSDNYYQAYVLPDERVGRNAPILSLAPDGRLIWRYRETTWGSKVGAYILIIVK